MALRPSEVKAVAKILDEPADDVTDLARRVITAINDSRKARKEFVVVLLSDGIVSTWGPYDTVKAAEKAVGRHIIASKPGKKGILTILKRDWETTYEEEE
jgi:hypothetical protein